MLKNYRFTLSNTEKGHDCHITGRVQGENVIQAVTKATGYWTFEPPYEDMQIQIIGEVPLLPERIEDLDLGDLD